MSINLRTTQIVTKLVVILDTSKMSLLFSKNNQEQKEMENQFGKASNKISSMLKKQRKTKFSKK